MVSCWLRRLSSKTCFPKILRLRQVTSTATQQAERKRQLTAAEEISDILKSEGAVSKQKLQAFQRTHSRLFGVSKEEWLRKRDLLVRAGMSGTEAGRIALYLPPALGFSLAKLQHLVKLCKQYDLNMSRILRRDPLVVSLPRNLVSSVAVPTAGSELHVDMQTEMETRL